MSTGRDIRVIGCRGSQIGDMIAALPIYRWVENQWPGSYRYWWLARKHAHAAPLLYDNLGYFNQLVISDCDEGMGPADRVLASTCHLIINPMPEHPPSVEPWPCVRSFYAETFIMSGLPMEAYDMLTVEEKRPRLAQWFPVERRKGVIGYYPCAAYGVPQTLTMPDGRRVVRSRNASRPWAIALVKRLQAEGYKVIQFGHPNDYADCGGALGADVDARGGTFMEQIIAAVSCDCVIGTDSGAGIALGAYGIPQVTLLTNHYPGHTTNLTAFAPDNPNNLSLVGVGSADNISHEDVVAAVKAAVSS